MERWERTVDGIKDVWEFERAGAVITERAGRDGATLVTREAHCDTEAMAEGIRQRMVVQRERQGYAKTAGEPVAAATGTNAKAARPAYPGLSDAKLGALVLRVQKAAAGDAHKVGDAITKATGDYSSRYPLAWFLLAHKLVAAETIPGLWDLLAEDLAHVDPAAVLALITAVPTGRDFLQLFKYPPMAWFVEGSTRSLDALLFAAYQRDPGLFEAHAGEFKDVPRRSLDLVRGRSGVAIDPARSRALLTEIATAHARRGLAIGPEMGRVDDGVVTYPRLADNAAVRAIALRFGTAADWSAALVTAALTAPDVNLHSIHDGLLVCTAAELATLFARTRSFGSNEGLAFRLHLVEHERADDPDALLAAAESLRDGDNHARAISEMFAVIAAARFAAQGRPVPDSLASLLNYEFISGVYHESIRPYVAGLRALPRARVIALAERAVDEPNLYFRALGPLLAWPDDALLARAVDRDVTNGYLDPELIGRFGVAALPHLARVWDATPRDLRRNRHRQVLAVLAGAAERGEFVDPAWDRYFTFDEEGGERLKYWDPSYAQLRERGLRGLPFDRRTAVLLRAATERPYPERPLGSAHVLDDAGLAAVAAAFVQRRAEGDRTQVGYALHALGERVVGALRGSRAEFAGDAAFVGLLRESLPPAQVDAILAD